MAKEKFTLQELQVESFVTALDETQMGQVKGGLYIVKGRRFTYTARWTAVDTRVDFASESSIGSAQTASGRRN